MISVNKLSKRYGRHPALQEVSLEVPKGQVLGLLGRNGAGKTTLLNLLSGYLPPSAGSIRLNGLSLTEEPLRARALVGYLPENPPLYPEMTAREYLNFCCALKGVDQWDREAHISEIVALTGIQEVIGRRLSNLSKGYRQRVGLAQALCGAPRILLLDEPTSGFDPSQAVAFREIVRGLAKAHTIIFSSHLLSEVEAICDRVLILHEGRLLYDRLTGQADDKDNASCRYELRTALPRQALLRALASLPSVLRARPYSQAGSFDSVEVETRRDAGFEAELITLLAGLEAPILLLRPLEESMEQIFLRLTGARPPEEQSA